MSSDLAVLFSTNFARTVLAGLAGMALVGTFDGFWKSDGNGDFQEQPFYLVLFVGFFLVLLTVSALMRGVTEALRSRVTLVRRSGLRAWLRSWWTALLVFLDTGFNMIQGKNQLQTAAYAQEIEELHRSLVLAVERIRRQLDEAFLKALQGEDPPTEGHRGVKQRHVGDAQIRTSIALMARDESKVFYVAREAGSLAKAFPRRSIAWLAIHTGIPLWLNNDWTDGKAWDKHKNERLLSQGSELCFNLPKPAILENYFEQRAEFDYKAFVVIPLPWQHRGTEEDYRKAGILVLFSEKIALEKLWSDLKETPWSRLEAKKKPPELLYPEEEERTGPHPRLTAKLQMAARVLEEVFRYFNDDVFEERLRPTMRPT